jgi:hypothetical protein
MSHWKWFRTVPVNCYTCYLRGTTPCFGCDDSGDDGGEDGHQIVDGLPGSAMNLQRCARALVGACLSVIVFAGGAGVGVARAQPVPVPPPVPPIIDPLQPLNPGLYVDPNDEGGTSTVKGDYGRFCENWWVRCQ